MWNLHCLSEETNGCNSFSQKTMIVTWVTSIPFIDINLMTSDSAVTLYVKVVGRGTGTVLVVAGSESFQDV
jgi:hypothetical protein